MGLAAVAGCAPPDATPEAAAPDAGAHAAPEELSAWRHEIAKTPQPAKGCFTATFPELIWHAAECATPPNRPYLPRSRGHAVPMASQGEYVGDGVDITATTATPIDWAEGSFDNLIGVTSESSTDGANAYSLQLNTQPFTTSACSGNCTGWEQFIYSSSGSGFMQYWMLDYAFGTGQCPLGWKRFMVGSSVDCWFQSTHAARPPSEPITALTNVQLLGFAQPTGDSVNVYVNNTAYSATGNNFFPELSERWTSAEFNVFGDGGGNQAVFNQGSMVFVRTTVETAAAASPTASVEGFTEETNNLTIVPGTTAIVPATFDPYGEITAPAVTFEESNIYEDHAIDATSTFGPETDGTWTMASWSQPGGAPDLVLIKTANTGTGHVEVHIASAASSFQTRVLDTATVFGNETDGVWQMTNWTQPGGKPDLAFIKTSNTGSGHVEVHIASAASNYQSHVVDLATGFANETDGTWLLYNWSQPTGKPDLVFIKTANTASGYVEIYVAPASTNYTSVIVATATTFSPETDGTWTVGRWSGSTTATPDLAFIKTAGTPSGNVEVHIASGASNFQTRTVQLATSFAEETDGTWLAPLWTHPTSGPPDLGFIKTGGPGNVQVHIASW